MDVGEQTWMGRRLRAAAASTAAIAVLGMLLVTPLASARPSFVAVSNEGACLANRNVNAFVRRNQGNVVRLILAPQDANAGAGVACVKYAHAAGLKVYLSLQFDNGWAPQQVASYFGRVLAPYAPYLWAIGVGNEQDLTSRTSYGQGRIALARRGQSAGQTYRAVWDAVEPVLVKMAPWAIRVYGEFSPWSFGANAQGFAAGRPRGVQAVAAHCYHTKVGGLLQVPQDAAWAASKRLPLWCSEMGPALARPARTSWALPDTWGSWNALVARIVAQSPNLKMTGYYYFPSF